MSTAFWKWPCSCRCRLWSASAPTEPEVDRSRFKRVRPVEEVDRPESAWWWGRGRPGVRSSFSSAAPTSVTGNCGSSTDLATAAEAAPAAPATRRTSSVGGLTVNWDQCTRLPATPSPMVRIMLPSLEDRRQAEHAQERGFLYSSRLQMRALRWQAAMFGAADYSRIFFMLYLFAGFSTRNGRSFDSTVIKYCRTSRDVRRKTSISPHYIVRSRRGH